jgi:Tfp pilus assembly protein PilO
MSDQIKKHLQMVNLIGAAIIVCGIAAPAAVGINKLFAQGRDSERETVTLKNRLSELDGLSKTLDQVDADRRETESRLNTAESKLPNSKAMDEFLHELASVAEDAGLQVDSTVPSKDLEDAGGYKSLPVVISGSGDWETCYRFLTGLRSMKRLTRLDSLVLDLDKTVKGPTDTPPAMHDQPMCHMSITISTFMAR